VPGRAREVVLHVIEADVHDPDVGDVARGDELDAAASRRDRMTARKFRRGTMEP